MLLLASFFFRISSFPEDAVEFLFESYPKSFALPVFFCCLSLLFYFFLFLFLCSCF